MRLSSLPKLSFFLALTVGSVGAIHSAEAAFGPGHGFSAGLIEDLRGEDEVGQRTDVRIMELHIQSALTNRAPRLRTIQQWRKARKLKAKWDQDLTIADGEDDGYLPGAEEFEQNMPLGYEDVERIGILPRTGMDPKSKPPKKASPTAQGI